MLLETSLLYREFERHNPLGICSTSIEINILIMILNLITTIAYFFLVEVRSGRRRREMEE